MADAAQFSNRKQRNSNDYRYCLMLCYGNHCLNDGKEMVEKCQKFQTKFESVLNVFFNGSYILQ